MQNRSGESPGFLGLGDRDKSKGDLKENLKKYLAELERNDYSSSALDQAAYGVNKFLAYAENLSGITNAAELSREIVVSFLVWLRETKYRKAARFPEQNYSPASLVRFHSILKLFLAYLEEKDILMTDLASVVPSPKIEERLPSKILSEEEIQKVCWVIDMSRLGGYRDRLLIEILYGSALRIGEAISLRLHQADLKNELFFVEQGKGKKDRTVPMSRAAKVFLEYYLVEVRPHLFTAGDGKGEDFLLLADLGGKMLQYRVARNLRNYGTLAGFDFSLRSHLFRHAFSVHMMRRGCDVRYVSAILGHARLTTTAVYTGISDEDLREKFEARHFFKRKILDLEETRNGHRIRHDDKGNSESE